MAQRIDRLDNFYGASRQSEGHTHRQPDVDASFPSSTFHLFIIIVAILIDHVEEPELVDPLACRDNAQPVAQLLFLEKLLRPARLRQRLPPSSDSSKPTSTSSSVH